MGELTSADLAIRIIEMWNRGEEVILEDSRGMPMFNLSELELASESLIAEEEYRKTCYYRVTDERPEQTPAYTLHYLANNLNPFL
ncbi:MAG: hypothetical protein GF372_08140 [Candidatus Marinimicrobia bacterium]|nr:hypothetical protein [Candidatus Neomarinimicrobiota bacterium]